MKFDSLKNAQNPSDLKIKIKQNFKIGYIKKPEVSWIHLFSQKSSLRNSRSYIDGKKVENGMLALYSYRDFKYKLHKLNGVTSL